jgi:hypothetical protein
MALPRSTRGRFSFVRVAASLLYGWPLLFCTGGRFSFVRVAASLLGFHGIVPLTSWYFGPVAAEQLQLSSACVNKIGLHRVAGLRWRRGFLSLEAPGETPAPQLR